MERITLTVEEVATMLGISLSLTYSMVRKKEIPHKKVGARILFHKPTIERWLTEVDENEI